MRRAAIWIGILLIPAVLGVTVAQNSGSGADPGAGGFSPEELDDLVAPIALYPDALLSVVLAASTQPFQIMEAARYRATLKGDVPEDLQVDWEDSVKELLYYPDILSQLNGDLDWTTKLGNAVRSQVEDVMDAVQRLRHKAMELGNLKTNDYIKVTVDGDDIIIELQDEEEMVAAEYDPAVVYVTAGFVWRRWWRWPCWRWRVFRCRWRHPRAIHHATRPHNPRYRGRANRPKPWSPRPTRAYRPGSRPAQPAVRKSQQRANTHAAASRHRASTSAASSRAYRSQAQQRQSSFNRSKRASDAQRYSQRGAQSRSYKQKTTRRTGSYQSRSRGSAYNRSYSSNRARSYSSRGRSSRGVSRGGSRGGGGGRRR